MKQNNIFNIYLFVTQIKKTSHENVKYNVIQQEYSILS